MLEGISSDFLLPTLYGGNDTVKVILGMFLTLSLAIVAIVVYHLIYVDSSITNVRNMIMESRMPTLRPMQMQTPMPTPTMRN
jgi:hypothetical protein